MKFKLKLVFLVIGILCCALAFRVRSPDWSTIHAVKNLGGKVFLTKQHPQAIKLPGDILIGEDTLPFEPMDVTIDREARSIKDFFVGPPPNSLMAVELSLKSLTPERLESLKSCEHLKIVVIDMPCISAHKSSPESLKFLEVSEYLEPVVFPKIDDWVLNGLSEDN